MYQRIHIGVSMSAATYGEIFSYVETFPSSSFATFPNIFLRRRRLRSGKKGCKKRSRNDFSIEILLLDYY